MHSSEPPSGLSAAPDEGPLVNIVMRTRNRETLLARAIADVVSQRFTSWTLTVVNDGGAVESVDSVVASFADSLAGRYSVVHLAESSGMEHASNVGLAAVDTLYVAIHDDDDTWHPSFLESTVAWLSAHDDASAVATRTEIVWEEMSAGAVSELGRETFLPGLADVTLGALVRFNCCVPISMLYRRGALEEIGGFDEQLEVTGDWLCNLRLAARGRIGFLPNAPLAFWHQRPTAHGDLGNSVIALAERHRTVDRFVRDRELREYVADSGLGLPLYLTRFIDDRFEELERRLDRIERVAADDLSHRIVRLLRRLRPRFKEAR